jgi:hypothetical protein
MPAHDKDPDERNTFGEAARKILQEPKIKKYVGFYQFSHGARKTHKDTDNFVITV